MTEPKHVRLSRARETMKELATPLSKMDIRITSTLITILDAMLETDTPMDRFGPESFRFTTRGVEYELAKYSPLGTVACTANDLIACLTAIPDEQRVPILRSALTGSFWEMTQREADSRVAKAGETWAVFFCYPDGDYHQTFELVRAYNSRDAAERSLAASVRGCPRLIDGAEDAYPVHVSARPEFEEGARGKHFWLIERLDVQT